MCPYLVSEVTTKMAYLISSTEQLKMASKYLLKLGVLVKVPKSRQKHNDICKYSEPNFQRNSLIWF